MASIANSIYSFKGFMKSFNSREFLSREDARKYSPFFDDNYNLVYWVNSSYDQDSGRRKKRSYFRHYPIKELTYKKTNTELKIIKEKDNRHKKTQNILMDIINEKISKSENLDWFYKDERLTDFPISGNLLKYVEKAKREHNINIAPLNLDYCLDIVLLGQKLNEQNIILGAIEIENTHEAEFLKVLVCKSLGFPLFTIDISEYNENEINKELCLKLLLETTRDNTQSRRRNFIYIHNLLLPIFIIKNNDWDFDEGHQYLIIMKKDEDIDRFKKYINILKNGLGLNEKNVLFQCVKINMNVASSITMQENDLGLLTQNTRDYNTSRYIRLVLERPEENRNLYIFHFILCKLLALHFDCIVGYKYKRHFSYEKNENGFLWNAKKYNKSILEWEYKKYCPKQLSEPIFMIVDEIKKHTHLFN
jgi:hypothetical protein